MGISLERIPVTLALGPDTPELATELTNALAHLENTGKLKLLREKWLGNLLTQEPSGKHTGGIFSPFSPVCWHSACWSSRGLSPCGDRSV